MKRWTADVVKETTITAGTGTVVLAQVTGWARFGDRFGDGERVYYSIRDGTNWEVGYGTYVAPNQLARTTIIGVLNAGAWADNGAALTLSGNAVVRAVAPEKVLTNAWLVEPIVCSTNTTLTAGKAYLVTASTLSLTLPSNPVVGDRVRIEQAVDGISGVTVDPGLLAIQGVAGVMTIDLANFAFSLVYVDAVYGWKVSQ